ncbi:MAG: glycoside hydrolase family 2 TIM barrel-domain containing protein [Cyclobacteriaceae bacterium]
MKSILFSFIILLGTFSFAQTTHTISLNGFTAFEQTKTAFPPKKYTRTIPVPGLIDLAKPKIEQYEAYFSGQHTPRYNWYKFKFVVPKNQKDRTAILHVLKSRFNTLVILNGHDYGSYMQNNTPIEVDLSDHLNYGKENELILRLGERAWMPKEAATGFDREKFTDFPGIWDDVFIAFGGPLRAHRALVIPDFENKKATLKVLIENHAKVLERNTEYAHIEYSLSAYIREKSTGTTVTDIQTIEDKIQCQIEQQERHLTFNFDEVKGWSPGNPFLYEAVVQINAKRKYFDNYGNTENQKPADDQAWIGPSDEKVITFGMRDFKSVEKSFELNGQEIALFGSTITLNRFFEDRDRAHLPWDKAWVKKMMVEIPAAMKWNFFRVSIGLLPEFWYDLADEHGIMIQNEYNMWNLRGRPSQYKAEYTDWIWNDGNHPSIIIWDALNEQKQDYIGRELIPQLREIDPSRLWDLGFMKAVPGSRLDVFEYHWYPLAHGWWVGDDYVKSSREAFRFGTLNSKVAGIDQMKTSNAPVIVNEFAWLWQGRDGLKSGVRTFGNFTDQDQLPFYKNYEYYEPDGTQLYKSDRDIYDYYVGENATADERWNFQAYLQAIETEMLRATREADGVASFAYLSNNRGHTGDWFVGDIKNLAPSQALLCQYHVTRPFAVFIDLADGRYLKNPKHYAEGSTLNLNLLAINDSLGVKKGRVTIQILDHQSKEVFSDQKEVTVDEFWQTDIPLSITLPETKGGYMILTTLDDTSGNSMNQVSRRYIIVGETENPQFPDYVYQKPPGWPQ